MNMRGKEVARRYRPYPVYKESGIEWLGDIPAHWEIKKIKQVCRFIYGDALPSNTQREGDVEVYGSNGPVGHYHKANTLAPCLVIGRKGSFGKVNFCNSPVFAIDTTFIVDRRCTNADIRWLYYVLTNARLDSYTKDSAIPGLDREDAYSRYVCVCPLEEQRAIATFLDRETAKIDALVAKKEQLIELLQERRSTLIARAVTKGRDPNVPLKDSGVEWLGQIPAHWEVKRISQIASMIQTGPFGSQLHTSDYVEGGIPIINPENIVAGRLIPNELCCVNEETASRLSRHRLCEGDIIMARRGEIGRCGVVSPLEAGWICGTGCLVIRLNGCDSRYFAKVLSNAGFSNFLELHAVGTTMLNLNPTIVGRMFVPVPPITEQRAIAAFLDRETAKLDALIAKIREGIERLKEYRTALISAAVTGKIDVRDAVGPSDAY